jgi:hypothetical protein
MKDATAQGMGGDLPFILLILLVELDGIEPTTSSMPLKRSPN